MLKSSQQAEQVIWPINPMFPLIYIFLLSVIIRETRVTLSYRYPLMRLLEFFHAYQPPGCIQKLNKCMLNMNPLLSAILPIILQETSPILHIACSHAQSNMLTCISPFSSGPHGIGVSPSADLTDLLEQFNSASIIYNGSDLSRPLCK